MSRFEIRWKIVEYLKQHSDKEHPIKPSKIFSELKKDGYTMSDEQSRKNAINEICDTLECGRVYNNETREKEGKIPNAIYYPHKFSSYELDAIFDALNTSPLFSKEQSENLISRLKEELASDQYKQKVPIHFLKPTSDATKHLRENLLLIRQAIEQDKQIEFVFGPIRNPTSKQTYASPYFIICTGGRYYLIAIIQIKDFYDTFTYRIDLMQNVKIHTRTPRIQTGKARGFPQIINDDYLRSHLYAAYDGTRTVTIKVDPEIVKADKIAFLYDYFGKSWIQKRSGEDGMVIEVKCSEFAATVFGMQYSDRVEILEPQAVRKMIIGRLNKMNGIYNKDKGNK